MKRQENAKAFASMQRMVGSFRQKPQLIACIEERRPNSLKQTRSPKQPSTPGCSVGAMGDAGEVESTGAQGDDDLFQFLELKRKEVAAMTQAAEIAREQALQLLRLQQEAARIDRLAEGSEGEGGITQDATFRQARSSGGDTLVESTALGSVGELPLTTLSLEDRQRFGLDVTPPPSEVLMFWKLVMVAMVYLLGARPQVYWPSAPSRFSAKPTESADGFQSKRSASSVCHASPSRLAIAATVAYGACRLNGRPRQGTSSSRGTSRVIGFSLQDSEWQADGTDGGQDVPDLKTCMVMAGFSFDAYTLIDRATGVWVCQGNQDQRGICGVQAVLLSSSFVRDAFRGILRARVLSAEGLRGAGMAGAVAVFFRTTAGESAGGLQGFQRNSVRRGVLNGVAQWLDEDDSVYLYVPKGALADSAADTAEEEICPSENPLGQQHHKHHRNCFDSHVAVGSLQAERTLRPKLVPETCQCQQHTELPDEVELKVDGDSVEEPEEEVDKEQPAVMKLQLEFDEFGEVSEVPELGSGVDEQVDDVTAEARYRRQRFGSNVPTEIRKPETERFNTHQLEAALRRRGLPWQGDGREVLEKRLQTSITAEQAIYDSGTWWNTVETVLGTDRKAQLVGALDVASSAAETLSGDLFGALGAGFMSGANEIAGVGELLKGDFAGAMQKRQEVWKAASTEDGRMALQQKADAAAMIRLAHGMELMSVRRGAWKMLQQAIQDEGAASDGQTASFENYEQLAYLEAPSTNTECWIWRFKASKRIVVAWRGTSDFGDVLTDIAATPRVIGDLGKVHEGFSRAYDSIRAALHAVLARGVCGDGHGWEIIFTGHSLGSKLNGCKRS
eukprot:symbB.v1.2.035332.t1/scaffold4731.1/size35673/1